MAVESAVALHEAREIDGVVVVAPNGVHVQWAEQQIERWGGEKNNAFAWRFSQPKNQRDFDIFTLFVVPDSPTRRLHWLCVNLESLIRPEVRKAIAKFNKIAGRCMLVIDESHHFARPGSKRTSVARALGRKFEYRRILTGTPVENSPLQAFSQFEILEKEALGHARYGTFKNEYAEYEYEDAHFGSRTFPQLVGYKNLDRLKDRMAPYASVVLRSDCEDLPPVQRDERHVEMTATQTRWWNATKEKLLEEVELLGQERVFAGGAALVKLQQIEGGFWRHPDRVEPVCGREDNPKMLILKDEVEQYDGQVIAWFEYVHELEAAYAALTDAKIVCGRFHGKVKPAEREDTLEQFRRRGVKVLLAQPRAGGEGRDMSVAGKIVWYSHTPDAVVRAQADERATAMGGDGVQIVDMVAPVGRYFMDICRRKTSVAEDVGRSGLRRVLESLR